MQLHVTGKNIEITSALKNFAEEKLQTLEKRFNSITKITITLESEHINHTAEGTVFLKNSEFHASAVDSDMYKAISAMVEKLLAQLNKHQDKLINSHH